MSAVRSYCFYQGGRLTVFASSLNPQSLLNELRASLLPGISEPLSRDTGSSTCRSSRLFNGLQESSNQPCTCAVSQPSARTRYDWLKRSGLSAAGKQTRRSGDQRPCAKTTKAINMNSMTSPPSLASGVR